MSTLSPAQYCIGSTPSQIGARFMSIVPTAEISFLVNPVESLKVEKIVNKLGISSSKGSFYNLGKPDCHTRFVIYYSNTDIVWKWLLSLLDCFELKIAD